MRFEDRSFRYGGVRFKMNSLDYHHVPPRWSPIHLSLGTSQGSRLTEKGKKKVNGGAAHVTCGLPLWMG